MASCHGPRLKLLLVSGLLLWIGCIRSEFSEQDIIIEYHFDKIQKLSQSEIPDEFRLKSFAQTEEGAFYKVQFQLDFPVEDIRDMSGQFRIIRRVHRSRLGKLSLGWE